MKKSICLLLAGLLLLPGCIRVPTYQQRSLELFKNNCTYRQTEEGITLCAKQLNSAEKYYLLSGRTTSLYDAEALYISIYNLSSDDYTISPEDIGLTQIAYPDIQKAIKKTSTVARFSGAAVLGGGTGMVVVGMWPIILNAILLPLTIASLLVAVPLVPIFLVQGIKSAVMNSRINKDLKEKIVHETVTVASGAHYEGLIFVKSSDYIPYFTIMMNGNDCKNRITFAVDLQ